MNARDPGRDEVVAATRRWVERAVIGLNLCPFARAVSVSGQVRYAVSDATNTGVLLEDLESELRLLSLTAAGRAGRYHPADPSFGPR